MKTYITLVMLILVLLSSSAETQAGDGDFDASFGTGGKQAIGFDLVQHGYETATGLGMTPDGKIYVVGTSEMFDRTGIAIGRLLASGEPDTTFGVNGKVALQGDEYAHFNPVDGAVLPDGRLLVVGEVMREEQSPENIRDVFVCRFLKSGEVDNDFGSDDDAPGCVSLDLSYHDNAKNILVQRDGKIVVSGFTISLEDLETSGTGGGLLARLSPDGVLDDGFGKGGIVVIPVEQPEGIGSYIHDVKEAVNGDLVAVGMSDVPWNHPANVDWRIYRLSSHGELVENFGDQGVVRLAFDQGVVRGDVANAVGILKDGSIVVAGYASFSMLESRGAVALLTATGELDTSFGDGGKKLYTHHATCQSYCDVWFNDLAVQSDGKLVMVGSSSGDATEHYDMVVLRLTGEGVADPGFGHLGWSVVDMGLSGSHPSDRANRVMLDSGRVLMAGSAYRDNAGTDMAVVRLVSDLIFTDDHE